MSTVIVIFLLALTVTSSSTPIVQQIALRLGFLDMPGPRKAHFTPVPLMGGLAIVCGAVTAFLLFLIEFTLTPRVIGVSAAAIVMVVMGLIDDWRTLPAGVKLAGQCVAVLILICFDVSVKLNLPEVLNYVISFLWVIAICNAVNFLDNLDGLCAGVSGVAAAFVVLIAATNDQDLVAALGAAVLGACLGFLRYNLKSATIFMGDAGSLFLGFVLAVLGILLRFPDNVNFVTWMVPVFILGVPIFDMILVIVSRIRRGANPFTTAGQDHVSHRLVGLGFNKSEAVLSLYLAGGMFGMVAMFIMQADVGEGYLVGGLVAGLCLYSICWFEKRHI